MRSNNYCSLGLQFSFLFHSGTTYTNVFQQLLSLFQVLLVLFFSISREVCIQKKITVSTMLLAQVHVQYYMLYTMSIMHLSSVQTQFICL